LVGKPGQQRSLSDAGLTAQQDHFPGAATSYATRQRIQLRQLRIALQQAIHQRGHVAL
jgi:hypothetical protein